MKKIVLVAAISAILSAILSASAFADTFNANGPGNDFAGTLSIPVTISDSGNSFTADNSLDDVASASGNANALVHSNDATIASGGGNAVADNDNSAVVGGNGTAINDSTLQTASQNGINYYGEGGGLGNGIIQGGHDNTLVQGDLTSSSNIGFAINTQSQTNDGVGPDAPQSQSQGAAVGQNSLVIGSGSYEYAPVIGAPGSITVGGENNSVDDSVANTGSHPVIVNDTSTDDFGFVNGPGQVLQDNDNSAIATSSGPALNADGGSAVTVSGAASVADDVNSNNTPLTISVDDVIIGDKNAVDGSTIDTDSNNTESGPGNQNI